MKVSASNLLEQCPYLENRHTLPVDRKSISIASGTGAYNIINSSVRGPWVSISNGGQLSAAIRN